MRGRTTMLVLLVLIAIAAPLGAVVAAAPATLRAQESQADLRDKAAAAATAQSLFALAAAGDYNALYDEIHPDAHAVVPRVAALGAFQAIYSAVQAGQSQVVGVSFVPWTWPVTGQSYDRAAKVDFVQPYTDENGAEAWLADAMYLVQDGDAWRWFFGSSKEFVDGAIAQYGNTDDAAIVTAPLTQGNVAEATVNDLDAFWRDVISYVHDIPGIPDITYQSPRVVLVGAGESAQSACGPAEGNFAGFYCPPDQTLYLDDAFMQGQEPFAAAFVIAHEWAHHIQSGVGFVRVGPDEAPSGFLGVYSIELELMADCMAGAWARDAETRGLIAPGDIDQAVQFALQVLGDPQYVGPYDPQAHGTGEQRATSIRNGYEQGFLGCNVKL